MSILRPRHGPPLLLPLLAMIIMAAFPARADPMGDKSAEGCDRAMLQALEAPSPPSSDRPYDGLEAWIHRSDEASVRQLQENTLSDGAMVAGGARMNPDYAMVWTRDEALGQLRRLQNLKALFRKANPDASDQAKKARMLRNLMNYLSFTEKIQRSPMPVTEYAGTRIVGTGHNPAVANVHADGSPNMKEWGNPQNDGPALRARVFIRLADFLMDHESDPAVHEVIPDPKQVIRRIASSKPEDQSVLLTDMDYTLNHTAVDEARSTDGQTRCLGLSFDYWEECMARKNFSTMNAQHQALYEASVLATKMGNKALADQYLAKARALEPEIRAMWDAGKKYLVAMKDAVPGHSVDKPSNLDAQNILSILEMEGPGSVFQLTDDEVLSTVYQAERLFSDTPQLAYEINGRPEFKAAYPRSAAIGRYIEDHYNGLDPNRPRGPGDPPQDRGNPWILIQNSWARFYARVATRFIQRGELHITDLNADFFRSAFADRARAARLLQPGMTIRKTDPLFREIMLELQAKAAESAGIVRGVDSNPPGGALYEQFSRDSWPLAPATTSSQGLGWNGVTFLDFKQDWEALKAALKTLPAPKAGG